MRQIQIWTDAGVLETIEGTNWQGRGRHRAYAAAPPWYGELAWALIAVELHHLGAPVGVMLRAIRALRGQVSPKSGAAECIERGLTDGYFALLISKDPESGKMAINHTGKTNRFPDRSGYFINIGEILRPLREQA